MIFFACSLAGSPHDPLFSLTVSGFPSSLAIVDDNSARKLSGILSRDTLVCIWKVGIFVLFLETLNTYFVTPVQRFLAFFTSDFGGQSDVKKWLGTRQLFVSTWRRKICSTVGQNLLNIKLLDIGKRLSKNNAIAEILHTWRALVCLLREVFEKHWNKIRVTMFAPMKDVG